MSSRATFWRTGMCLGTAIACSMVLVRALNSEVPDSKKKILFCQGADSLYAEESVKSETLREFGINDEVILLNPEIQELSDDPFLFVKTLDGKTGYVKRDFFEEVPNLPYVPYYLRADLEDGKTSFYTQTVTGEYTLVKGSDFNWDEIDCSDL